MASIQGIYVALFGRPADPAGLEYFNEQTNSGLDLTAIGDLASTAEYQARFTGMTNEQIVNSIYQSLFERDGEQDGIDFFVSKLEDGTYNINNIAIAILDGAQGDDLATVNAKIAAANLFTERLDLEVEIDAYDGAAAAAIGRDFINSVDKDNTADTVETDAAIQLLLDAQEGGAPGGGGGGGGGVSELTLAELLAYTAGNEPDVYDLSQGPEDLGTINVDDLDRIPGLIQQAQNGAAFNGYSADLTDNFDNIATTTDAELSSIDVVTANNNGQDEFSFTQFVTTDLVINVGDGGTTFDDADLDGLAGIQGGMADDVITGGTGNDYLRGMDGDDQVEGGMGNDSLHGNQGNDTVNGGGGDDVVRGGGGNDTVRGGGGNDQVFGDIGDDLLVGATGTDTFEGGAGVDTFQFFAGTSVYSSATTVTDFASGTDMFDVGTVGDYVESDLGNVGIIGHAAYANAFFFNGGNDVYVAVDVSNSGNSWLMIDSNGDGTWDGNDTFVVLTGINQNSEISASDFA